MVARGRGGGVGERGSEGKAPGGKRSGEGGGTSGSRKVVDGSGGDGGIGLRCATVGLPAGSLCERLAVVSRLCRGVETGQGAPDVGEHRLGRRSVHWERTRARGPAGAPVPRPVRRGVSRGVSVVAVVDGPRRPAAAAPCPHRPQFLEFAPRKTRHRRWCPGERQARPRRAIDSKKGPPPRYVYDRGQWQPTVGQSSPHWCSSRSTRPRREDPDLSSPRQSLGGSLRTVSIVNLSIQVVYDLECYVVVHHK